MGSLKGVVESPDRYLKNVVGVRWQQSGAMVDAQLLTVGKNGSFENAFGKPSDANAIYMATRTRATKDTQFGYYVGGELPLRYGLSVQGWGFMQAASSTPTTSIYRHAFSRFYFERNFFKAPLTIRSHLSYEYVGPSAAFSDANVVNDRRVTILPGAQLVGFRLSATIKGVTLMWGTENLLNQAYSLLPGYPRIGKEEYLQFIWRLWL